MKLYGTITSERATKGQGGKALCIRIYGAKGESEYPMYTIGFTDYGLTVMSRDGRVLFEKQTLSGDHCAKCGELWQEHMQYGGNCPPNEKGNKQKGEKCTECKNGVHGWCCKNGTPDCTCNCNG